jgi:TonB family protein
VLIWQGFKWKNLLGFGGSNTTMEVDLTRPFRLTDNPALAKRALISGTGAPVVTAPKPAAVAPVEPPKDWVLPGPSTQVLEQPAANEDAGPAGLGGLGDGTGFGEVDWVYLTELPRILNKEDLLRDIKRFYPESERLAGREGDVGLVVHIDPDGRVRSVDVAEGAGPLFNEAAQKVIAVARFSPAKAGSRQVAVKIRQTISFRLEE